MAALVQPNYEKEQAENTDPEKDLHKIFVNSDTWNAPQKNRNNTSFKSSPHIPAQGLQPLALKK